jgi:hypothetical protein
MYTDESDLSFNNIETTNTNTNSQLLSEYDSDSEIIIYSNVNNIYRQPIRRLDTINIGQNQTQPHNQTTNPPFNTEINSERIYNSLYRQTDGNSTTSRYESTEFFNDYLYQLNLYNRDNSIYSRSNELNDSERINNYYNTITDILERTLNTEPIYNDVISEKGKTQIKHDTFKNNLNYNTTCPILLIDFEDDDDIAILPCNHCFTPDAIYKWLEKEKAECPVCRYKLPSKESRNINNETQNNETLNNETQNNETQNNETQNNIDYDTYSGEQTPPPSLDRSPYNTSLISPHGQQSRLNYLSFRPSSILVFDSSTITASENTNQQSLAQPPQQDMETPEIQLVNSLLNQYTIQTRNYIINRPTNDISNNDITREMPQEYQSTQQSQNNINGNRIRYRYQPYRLHRTNTVRPNTVRTNYFRTEIERELLSYITSNNQSSTPLSDTDVSNNLLNLISISERNNIYNIFDIIDSDNDIIQSILFNI